MSQTGEAAEQIVNMATNVTVKGVECVANLSGKAAVSLAAFLIAALKDEKRVSGKTRMRSFRGKPTQVFVIKQGELRAFAQEAKKYGVLYAAVVDKRNPDGLCDIVVSAEKKSTFSRLSQNETAKECYQLGFFAPQNADAALAALEMMDFEGIEKVRQRVRQNGTLAQQLAQMQAQMAQLTGLLEVQKKSKDPKLSGPAQELSTAAMARAMKTQKGEMR